MHIALYDIDGVIVPEGDLFFPRRLERDFNIDHEKIMLFFEKDFYYCLIGKKDLKEELTRHLRTWGWTGSVEELMEYWFSTEKYVDERLLEDIQRLRSSGVKCYITSHQEKYRAEYLLNNVGLKDHFDGAFFSCYVGYMKFEYGFWKHVCDALEGTRPDEMVYWDNDKLNTDAAFEVGIKSFLYESYEHYKNTMEQLSK